MDEGDMRALLEGRLRDADWGPGVDKDQLMAMFEDDEALQTLIGQYVAQGRYASPEEVLNVIPQQGWQDTQGDTWRGGEIHDFADMPTHFREGPVGQDESDVYQQGEPPPATPGFGQSAGAAGDADPTA
ncbi:MAG: hypothetical protein M3Q71_08065 [Chloroflexota bacterium]|nr:hypothetical protein [Chloroflexota bacterium]